MQKYLLHNICGGCSTIFLQHQIFFTISHPLVQEILLIFCCIPSKKIGNATSCFGYGTNDSWHQQKIAWVQSTQRERTEGSFSCKLQLFSFKFNTYLYYLMQFCQYSFDYKLDCVCRSSYLLQRLEKKINNFVRFVKCLKHRHFSTQELEVDTI